MKHDAALERRSPSWWNHQRQPLRGLTDSLTAMLEKDVPPSGGRVIDLGAGDRPYEPLFRARGFDYVACDLSGTDVVPLEPGTAVPLPDGEADGVVSFQVLEHVWDLDWYLGEAHRLLKPGGWLLLSTHGSWLYHPHPTDYRRWTRDGLTGELVARGFAIRKVAAIIGPLAWTTQFRLLGMREALLKIPRLGRFLAYLVAVMMNLRMELEDRVTPAAIREVNACIYLTLSDRQPKTSPGT